MEVSTLIVAVIVGLLALILVLKFWKLFLGLGVMAAIIFGAFLCLSGELNCPFGKNPGPDPDPGPAPAPTNPEIIHQVYKHLLNKTYVEVKHGPGGTKTTTHRCPTPPPVDSPYYWYVVQDGKNKWIVHGKQGKWIVEKTGRGFVVTTNNRC